MNTKRRLLSCVFACLSFGVGSAFAGDPIDGFMFQPFDQYDTGDNATGVDLADLDGDLDLDAVVSNRDSNDVAILLNNGDGTFAAAVSYPVGNQPRYVTVADFDGDQDPDIATSDRSSSTITVLMNNGDATFVFHQQISQGAPDWIGSLDNDEDGDIDIILTKFTNPPKLSILENDGDGNFSVGATYTTDFGPRGGDFADFNGDGLLDIIITCVNDHVANIFWNIGGGLYSARTVIPCGSGARYPAAGDFDLDGDMDFAVANKNSNDLWVFFNNGAGGFVSELNDRYPLANIPHSLENGDLDADGDLDLIASHVGAPILWVLGNDGLGNFSMTQISSEGGPAHVVAGDLDDDDDLDLITANTNNGTANVHLSETAQGPSTSGRLAIELDASTLPARPGEPVVVEVWMRDITGALAAGYQAFIGFEPTQMEFISGEYADEPFGLPLINPIAEGGAGEVDIAAALDAFSGQTPTDADALLATLTFEASVAFCQPEVTFRFHQPPSRLTDDIGAPIVPLVLDQPQGETGVAAPILTIADTGPGGPYESGDTITITLDMAGLLCAEAVGYQAFLHFPPTQMTFISGSYTDEPFGLHLLNPITADNEGNIDLAAGTSFSGGQEPATGDGLLVELIFEANTALCNPTLTFRDSQPPSRITDPNGTPLEPLALVDLQPNPCPGDVTGAGGDPDGVVSFPDLLNVLSTWGPCPACPGDVNCSGVIDFADLLILLSTWGPCP